MDRAAFDFTIDDLADVALRNFLGRPAGRRARRRQIIGSTIVTWMSTTLLFVLTSGLRDFKSLMGIGVTSAVIAVLVSAYQAPHYGARFKRCMAKALAEELGSNPMHCEVELRPDHLWTRQGNMELRCSWKDLTSIADLPEGVELRFRDGYVMVRSRAFATDADRAAFTARARTLASGSP